MTKRIIYGFPIFSFIFALIAYFVYGHSFDAAVAIFLMSLGINIIAFLGIITIFGVVFYIFLSNKLILLVIFLVCIEATKLTGFIFLIGLIGAIIYTIITLLIILVIIVKLNE